MGIKNCDTYCAIHFFASTSGTHGIAILEKNIMCHSLFLPLFCLCIRCGSGNDPIRGQYTILNHHGVTATGGLWILHVKPHRFQGVQLDYCNRQATALCEIGQIIGGGGVAGRACLG